MVTFPSRVKFFVFLVILPVRMETKDDFPAPDCPIIQKSSPLLMEPLRSLRMGFLVGLWVRLTDFHLSISVICFVIK